MKKHLKKILTLFVNIFKNVINLYYRNKYEEVGMLNTQLKLKNKELTKRNESLELQLELLSR